MYSLHEIEGDGAISTLLLDKCLGPQLSIKHASRALCSPHSAQTIREEQNYMNVHVLLELELVWKARFTYASSDI